MFKRIRKLWKESRKQKKDWNTLMATAPLTFAPHVSASAQPEFWINKKDSNNSLSFQIDGDTIFSIDDKGYAEWHKEDMYNEAASIFLDHITLRIESTAGIRESRMEWEKRIAEKLGKIAKENGGSLSAELLTNTVKKCIMNDRLKGSI